MKRYKILFSLAALVFIVVLLGGATAAWFMAKADAPLNQFTAGTLLITADVKDFAGGDNWNPGHTEEATYTVKNQGSKCSLLRASIEGRWFCECGEYVCNTAMVRMDDDPNDFTHQWPGHPWFTYIKNEPTFDKKRFFFYAGRTHRVGVVDVWKENDNLYVDIRLDDDQQNNYAMNESQVKVATSLTDLTSGPGRGLAFGLWDQNITHDPKKYSYTHVVPWDNSWNNKELYIGVHAAVCGQYFSTDNGDCVEFCPPHYDDDGLVEVVSVEPCDANWKLGSDGYFYYVGGDNCLEALPAGETAELCVEVHLDGEKTDERYQNKEFRFEATFEAIQCTNNAAQENGWLYFCNHD